MTRQEKEFLVQELLEDIYASPQYYTGEEWKTIRVAWAWGEYCYYLYETGKQPLINNRTTHNIEGTTNLAKRITGYIQNQIQGGHRNNTLIHLEIEDGANEIWVHMTTTNTPQTPRKNSPGMLTYYVPDAVETYEIEEYNPKKHN